MTMPAAFTTGVSSDRPTPVGGLKPERQVGVAEQARLLRIDAQRDADVLHHRHERPDVEAAGHRRQQSRVIRRGLDPDGDLVDEDRSGLEAETDDPLELDRAGEVDAALGRKARAEIEGDGEAVAERRLHERVGVAALDDQRGLGQRHLEEDVDRAGERLGQAGGQLESVDLKPSRAGRSEQHERSAVGRLIAEDDARIDRDLVEHRRGIVREDRGHDLRILARAQRDAEAGGECRQLQLRRQPVGDRDLRDQLAFDVDGDPEAVDAPGGISERVELGADVHVVGRQERDAQQGQVLVSRHLGGAVQRLVERHLGARIDRADVALQAERERDGAQPLEQRDGVDPLRAVERVQLLDERDRIGEEARQPLPFDRPLRERLAVRIAVVDDLFQLDDADRLQDRGGQRQLARQEVDQQVVDQAPRQDLQDVGVGDQRAAGRGRVDVLREVDHALDRVAQRRRQLDQEIRWPSRRRLRRTPPLRPPPRRALRAPRAHWRRRSRRAAARSRGRR